MENYQKIEKVGEGTLGGAALGPGSPVCLCGALRQVPMAWCTRRVI